jgi:hypothetical protein
VRRRRRAFLVAAAVALAGGAAARLRGGGELVDLVYADGSSVTLPDTHFDAQRLLPYARDIRLLTRDEG